ncbi:MAG: FAD-dependent oxidoreductase, partial [Phycisphaerales bacterium]|nr:FAD-dependent oxidoreductase [Phycisphaerales bacterium]
IYGGKLTAYRATAERVMERLAATLPLRPRRARTDTLPLEPASA